MPYFCPILPGTPSGPPGSTVRPDRGRTTSPTGSRTGASSWNGIPYYGGSRTANPDRIVWTIEPDPALASPGDRAGRERLRGRVRRPERSCPRPRQQIWPESARRSVPPRFPTLTNFLFRFNTDRPAFKGTGQAPLRKAINYALDRLALARAHGHLAARPSDRLLPAPLSASRPSIRSTGRISSPHESGLRAPSYRPQKLTLYMANFPFSIAVAQEFSRI